MTGYLNSSDKLTKKLYASGFEGFSLAKEAEGKSSEQPGLLCDRYRILRPLGQGGFGKTFLAVDQQQNLPCVIKQLQSNSVHQQKALELFRQEAQRLTELGEHPQIPKLLNTFEQDGLFIVQEWIDGWTLEEELLEGEFSEAEIRKLLQALLPVLQYLHDRHIIHRDIKPANIIRRKHDRQLVLVDFGAAKQISDMRTISPGTLIGSAEYAAPEQVKGQSVFASDLYSLGVTCLHLLTQISPFDLYDLGEDAWEWQEYLAQPISPALKAILCKLLQPGIRRRYQSAAEVLTDLDASSVSAAEQLIQVEDAKPLSSETVPSVKLLASSVQATRSISAATIYLPQTQDWHYLPCEMNASGESKAAFFLSPRLAAAAATPPVQEAPLFADDIAGFKTLPLVWQVLIAGIGTAIGCVAITCVVACLGIIFFTLSTPPHSGTTFRNSPEIIRKF